MSNPLANTIALVTGASRGVGKGVALGLGEAGAPSILPRERWARVSRTGLAP
jgi:NAD(P)-dependent dehydrogenase (short-subunit alcohol dehydrogenase family)